MKYFRRDSLDKTKIVPILEEYRRSTGSYPMTNEFKQLKKIHKEIFPSVKWIQNKGGIVVFYRSLGIEYLDARTGVRRSDVAKNANKKSQSLDVTFSELLVEKYGEKNVHWQALYNKGLTLHRSDFKVYKPDGTFFFIDLFFPKDVDSLVGCVNLKIKKLSKVKIDKSAPIYFISCNEVDISPSQVERYLLSRKNPIPKNITVLHIKDARKKFL